jgi:hypothetical protein
MSALPQRRVLLLFVLGFMAAGVAGAFAGQLLAVRICWTIAALPIAAVVARDAARTLAGGALGETFTAALIALMVAGGNALE